MNTPWTTLGTAMHGGETATEMLEAAQMLDWDLRKETLQTPAGLVVPGKYAIVRDNPLLGTPEPLGVVGEAYRINPNESLVPLLEDLLEHPGAVPHAAGTMDEGSKFFITLEMREWEFPVTPYMSLLGSYDGSLALCAVAAPVAAEGCLVAVQGHGLPSPVRARLDGAHQIVSYAQNYFQRYSLLCETLSAKQMDRQQLEAVLQKEYGAGPKAGRGAITRSGNKITQMVALFEQRREDTAWAAFTALCEWSDRHSHTRGGNPDLLRARNAILGSNFKSRALSILI